MGNFSPSPFGGGGFGSGGGDIMFTIVPVIMVIMVVIFIVLIISNGVRYAKNARSPRATQYARIISKRMDVHHSSSHHGDNITHSSSSRTYYYITLEFDNGERKEYLDVKNLYGLVAEGDVGYAAVQGDWIVAFERDMAGRQSGSGGSF
ncbi:DUF2500 domain-containing protein [Paenibacillus macerans]|uniref:DUF2500 domain-containing protein n=1 Tax=Paenibacillus macerans TaxID=44252 RepID=UPI003D32049A